MWVVLFRVDELVNSMPSMQRVSGRADDIPRRIERLPQLQPGASVPGANDIVEQGAGWQSIANDGNPVLGPVVIAGNDPAGIGDELGLVSSSD